MTTVPLTVLAYEGPLARAYLARMRRAGLRPKCVVLIVQSHHPATKKPVGRWLPYGASVPYAQRMRECVNLHWPRRIRAAYPNLVSAILREMAKTCDNPAGLITEILGCFRYDDQTLYRAIFSFCDPLLRAEFFVQNVVSHGTDPAFLPASS